MYKKLLGSLLLLLPGFLLKAQLKLPRLCSDGMVLQSSRPVPVWGWAKPGEPVQVAFLGHRYKATADSSGRWQLALPAEKPGGPFVMTITSGKEKISLKDILIGEVWVCSGQSNMEHDLTSVTERYPKLLAEGNYPRIRQFKVPNRYNFKLREVDYGGGSWLPATHEHIGEFSAVGFFFAQQLQQKTKEAVGIINISLGGSPIEAWLPESALKAFPPDYEQSQLFKNDSLIEAIETSDRKKSAAWSEQLNHKDRGEAEGWRTLNISHPEVQNWPTMSVPGYWADQQPGQVNGVIWLKKSIRIHKGDKQPATAKLVLGRMVDADSVFVNGQFVGTTGYQYPRRRYVFPENLLREGENTITIRLVSQVGKGGFVPDKVYALVRGKDTISLAGRWKYQLGASMPVAPGQTFVRWMPAGLFNGMLAPAFTFGVKGFIWYQGESNADNATEYFAKLKALLEALRKGWQDDSLPFLVVQLPNFMQQNPDPNGTADWAVLRDQQSKILSLPRTDMAVTIDLGEWNDVHPLDKQPVGERLYWLAADLCYAGNGSNNNNPDQLNINPAHHSPMASKASLQGDTVFVAFRLSQPLQIKKGSNRLAHFAIAGSDGIYHWAEAGIQGSQVWVYSPDVKAPVKVRYAWSDNPFGANLQSKAGLPAAPFELGVTK